MASKSKAAAAVSDGFALAKILWRPKNRALVLTALVVVASIAGALYAWRHWGPQAIDHPDYVVTPERISVNSQPAWIRANVKAEVLQSMAAARLDLLDRELVEKLADAFELHPWVARVVRVEKRFPAHVSVELEYRRPVLAVKMDAAGDDGLLFLDSEGVLLPHADFTSSQAKDFLRLAAAGETPTSVYGTPWDSERIRGAAHLAAVWADRWQPLGLNQIVAARAPSGRFEYELRSPDEKLRIVWGAAPGDEPNSEPAPEQKLAALDQYLKDHPPADSAAPLRLDLRQLAASSTNSQSTNSPSTNSQSR